MKNNDYIKRNKPIQKKGHLSTLWEVFAAKLIDERRESDGKVACAIHPQERLETPDAHHIIDKTERPDLYFYKPNIIHVCRIGHGEIHDGTHHIRTDILESKLQADGYARKSPSLHQIRQGSGLRRNGTLATKVQTRKAQTVFSSGSSRDNDLLPRPTTGSRSVFDIRRDAESRSL